MLQLDHIVHFLDRDSKDAIEHFKGFGFNVTEGGRHELWGTKNSLCYGKDAAYIEWLSIEDRDVASICDNPLIRQQLADLKRGEGFGQICLRTDDIRKLAETLTSKGHSCRLFDGHRKKTDGTTLKWKMLFLEERFGNQLPYPFFIQWEKSDEDRLEEFYSSGMLNGFSIKRITYLVQDAETAAQKLADILEGQEFLPYKTEKPDLIGYKAKIGSTSIFLAETKKAQMDGILKERGERPAVITFAGIGDNEIHLIWGGYYQFSTM